MSDGEQFEAWQNGAEDESPANRGQAEMAAFLAAMLGGPDPRAVAERARAAVEASSNRPPSAGNRVLRSHRWQWLLATAAMLLVAFCLVVHDRAASADLPMLLGAAAPRRLVDGEMVATGVEARLRWGDGSEAVLAPEARASVHRGEPRLRLITGSAVCAVPARLDASAFTIAVADGAASADEAGFAVTAAGGRAMLTVSSGAVRWGLHGNEGRVVRAGETETLPGGVSISEPPDERRILASADAMVRAGDSADTNYGTRPMLLIKGDAVVDFHRQVLLRFPLSGLRVPPERAVLRLRPIAGHPYSWACEVRAVIGAWGEATVTWRQRPGIGEVLGSWRHVPNTVGEVDLTAAVRAAVAAERDLDCWLVPRDLLGGRNPASYHSREAGVEFGPTLVLTLPKR